MHHLNSFFCTTSKYLIQDVFDQNFRKFKKQRNKQKIEVINYE